MTPVSSPSSSAVAKEGPAHKKKKLNKSTVGENKQDNTNLSSSASSTLSQQHTPDDASSWAWERCLPLVVTSNFLSCRDLGRLLLRISKAVTASAAAIVIDDDAEDSSSTTTEQEASSTKDEEDVWKILCLHHWGGAPTADGNKDGVRRVREFLLQTGLNSWMSCFRELSHYVNPRRPHKYYAPFVAVMPDDAAGNAPAPPPPPVLTMDPSDFSLVVDVRRRNTGKILFYAALTGNQLAGFFQTGSLPVGLSSRHNTELEDCDLDEGNSSGDAITGAGSKVFSWDGQVHLIRHSDQTVVKLLELHQTDTLWDNYVIQENDILQDREEWKYSSFLVPKSSDYSNRLAGLQIGREPPHESLSLSSLFGQGFVRLGLILEYTTRGEPGDLASSKFISGFHFHANLLSRRLGQEVLLAWFLQETDWQFAHILQSMEVFSNNTGGGSDDNETAT